MGQQYIMCCTIFVYTSTILCVSVHTRLCCMGAYVLKSKEISPCVTSTKAQQQSIYVLSRYAVKVAIPNKSNTRARSCAGKSTGLVPTGVAIPCSRMMVCAPKVPCGSDPLARDMDSSFDIYFLIINRYPLIIQLGASIKQLTQFDF